MTPNRTELESNSRRTNSKGRKREGGNGRHASNLQALLGPFSEEPESTMLPYSNPSSSRLKLSSCRLRKGQQACKGERKGLQRWLQPRLPKVRSELGIARGFYWNYTEVLNTMGRLSQREENSRATSSYFPRAPAPYPATPPSMDPPTYSCPFYWWDFAPTWLKGKFWLVHQVYPTFWHCNMLLPSTKFTLKNCTVIKHTHKSHNAFCKFMILCVLHS